MEKNKKKRNICKKKREVINNQCNWMHSYAKTVTYEHNDSLDNNQSNNLNEPEIFYQHQHDCEEELVNLQSNNQEYSASEENSHDESEASSHDESDNDNDVIFLKSDNDRSAESCANLKDKLRFWAISFQVKQNAVNALLSILKENNPQADLPVDARTLLQTPRKCQLVPGGMESDNGKYWHYGLLKVLHDALSNRVNVPEHLQLNINIDGLPMFKSSYESFWPILVNIHQLRDEISPLIVGIFSGKSE